MIQTIVLVVVSISSLFLAINWSAPSLYIFNQTVFAFQPSNQQQGEGRQQQEEETLLLSSSSSNDSSYSVRNTNTSGHPASSPPPLQHSQRGTITTATATMTVEIVLGAAQLGNKSYDPNPLITGPNTTIVWHNADEILHTVTSGLGIEDNNNMKGKEFDSSIIIPDNSYFHTFSEIGEYPYFCTLHPGMVGKIIIIRNET